MSKIDELESRISLLESINRYQKIQKCPYCKHYTLQYYSGGGVWVCVICGSQLVQGLVLKEK